ncbi:YfcC family protein [Halobacillus amylolyticus]|uniref:YfcC family protein n=1 Tax=Halobacillus amylolyticus TaxID=2932259 RepID=A0ABY4H969_9BACI|nr:YfcC family protein [Halobacillus amylolyticus]UOR11423.1 YfcC family protein [Halobacillus amylolyticus]
MAKSGNSANKRSWKQRLAMPDAFVILFGLLLLAAIFTYIIPAGSFERETTDDDITQVIPGSYTATEANPASIMDIFLAIQNGLVDTAHLIFMVLIIGGTVAVFEYTGAVNSGINALIEKTKGKKYLLIISVIALFAILDTAGVSGNAVIAFIPIGIILARALKLDAITGVAMVYLGQYVGVATGTFDPVITGIAQRIAELPLFSGAVLRGAAFVVLLVVTIAYICLYVKRISNDPSSSKMGVTPFTAALSENEEEDFGPFTTLHKIIILTFFVFLGVFLFGVYNMGWSINELSAIFLMMAIAVAIIAKITPNKLVSVFMNGARGLVYGALVIGMARAVVLLLEDGYILDTIVNYAFEPLETLPTVLGAQALYVFNLLFNLLVTSGSGQAVIVMPFIVPLVDMLDITRQTGVLAFKLGDGITNIITPTSGILMAVLAIGGVSWMKWFRFVWPLVLIWAVIGAVFVSIAVFINYGPF